MILRWISQAVGYFFGSSQANALSNPPAPVTPAPPPPPPATSQPVIIVTTTKKDVATTIEETTPSCHRSPRPAPWTDHVPVSLGCISLSHDTEDPVIAAATPTGHILLCPNLALCDLATTLCIQNAHRTVINACKWAPPFAAQRNEEDGNRDLVLATGGADKNVRIFRIFRRNFVAQRDKPCNDYRAYSYITLPQEFCYGVKCIAWCAPCIATGGELLLAAGDGAGNATVWKVAATPCSSPSAAASATASLSAIPLSMVLIVAPYNGPSHVLHFETQLGTEQQQQQHQPQEDDHGDDEQSSTSTRSSSLLSRSPLKFFACVSDYQTRCFDLHKIISSSKFTEGMMNSASPQCTPAEPWSPKQKALAPRVLVGHTAPVKAIAFSPCRRFIATASMDLSVLLFEAETVYADAATEAEAVEREPSSGAERQCDRTEEETPAEQQKRRREERIKRSKLRKGRSPVAVLRPHQAASREPRINDSIVALGFSADGAWIWSVTNFGTIAVTSVMFGISKCRILQAGVKDAILLPPRKEVDGSAATTERGSADDDDDRVVAADQTLRFLVLIDGVYSSNMGVMEVKLDTFFP